MRCLLLGILLYLVRPQGMNGLIYATTDQVIVDPNDKHAISLVLTSTVDQYLDDETVEVHLEITQITDLPAKYDLLVFNFQNDSICYENWYAKNISPPHFSCSGLINLGSSCAYYFDCFLEHIYLSTALIPSNYTQNKAIIRNVGTSVLKFRTKMEMVLSFKNIWLYLGVGLICFLLISCVVCSGTIYYWLAEYNRTKKMYEQFKLTEGGAEKTQ